MPSMSKVFLDDSFLLRVSFLFGPNFDCIYRASKLSLIWLFTLTEELTWGEREANFDLTFGDVSFLLLLYGDLIIGP